MWPKKSLAPPTPAKHNMIFSILLILLFGAAQSSPIVERGVKVPIPAGQEVHYKTMDAQQGTYEFGYDTGVGEAQSYRYENRTSEGKVYGKYGYIAPDGILREVHYVADTKGFRTFQINRYPVNSNDSPFIGPIPSRLKFS